MLGAGYQQHESHGTEQQEQRRPQVPHELFMEWPHADAPGFVRVGALLFETLRDELHLRLRLLPRRPRFEPAGHAQDVRSGRRDLVGAQRKRRPELRARGVEPDDFRHDTDDLIGLAIQDDRLPDNLWVGPKRRCQSPSESRATRGAPKVSSAV
jgi:hypothetical protein